VEFNAYLERIEVLEAEREMDRLALDDDEGLSKATARECFRDRE